MWKPNVKRNLRRLAHTADEQEQRDHRDCLNLELKACPAEKIDGLSADAGRLIKNLPNVQRCKRGKGQYHAEQQASRTLSPKD